ncbi:hypothetical protein SELMODRAFT_444852 [Selaginella moellendorffii]|uniref:Uncharacterized protein n=1 Tax=Selaginella moellendorffii TaxID=88036 RepID=D8SDE8_SELML|nr:hypothetical protein SELMODRAFT_444852 [Selaginella moellendorffii]
MSMLESTIKPDQISFVNVLEAITGPELLRDGEFIHKSVVENGFENDGIIGSALLGMYSRCENLEKAEEVFAQIGRPYHSVIAWNSMLATYTAFGRCKEAIKLFMDMQQDGSKASEATFATLLAACAGASTLAQGKMVVSWINEWLMSHTISACSYLVIQNATINMYAKCGSLDLALQTFNSMHQRDVTSWNSVLGTLARHGIGKEAIDLLHMAEEEDDLISGLPAPYKPPRSHSSHHEKYPEKIFLIQDKETLQWRRLPPVSGFQSYQVGQVRVYKARLVAGCGAVYAWTVAPTQSFGAPEGSFIFKLDIGRGDWIWKRVPASQVSRWSEPVFFNGKIYSLLPGCQPRRRICSCFEVMEYDPETGSCHMSNKWPSKNVGVILSSSSPQQQLYGVVRTLTNGQQLMVNEGGSWQLHRELPALPDDRVFKFKLVNGDCFEPAVEGGVNVLAILLSHRDAVVYWFNTEVNGANWVAIEHQSQPGNVTQCVAVQGSLYAISRNFPRLHYKLWKGTINVAERLLIWEQRQRLQVSLSCFTLMA